MSEHHVSTISRKENARYNSAIEIISDTMQMMPISIAYFLACLCIGI